MVNERHEQLKLHVKKGFITCIYIHIQFVDKGGPDLELVTCSGHAKNGALCILQVW